MMSYGFKSALNSVLLLGLLALAACGFQPLYGNKGGQAETDLSQVAIATIPDRDGQMLRNYLIDRMYQNGRPAAPAYELTVSLTRSESSLGIRRDATASRTRLDMTAHYALKRRGGDNKNLLDGTALTSVSFNQLDAQYATVTSREDAYTRALNEVGEQIVGRLALYFGTVSQQQ